MNDSDDNIGAPISNESNDGVVDRCRGRVCCARGGDAACGRGGEDERRSMTSGIVLETHLRAEVEPEEPNNNAVHCTFFQRFQEW